MITSSPHFSLAEASSTDRPRRATGASVPAELREYYQGLLATLGWPARPSSTGLQTLGFTSACRNEGVSTVASHLAATAASLGERRVALVNLDAQRLTLETTFHCTAAPGISELFASQAQWSDIVQETSVANLFLLAAGKQRDAQTILSDGSRLANLIETLKANFDLVLFDIPAITATGSGLSCAGLLDGVVLVVEAERVRWEVAQRAKELLARTGANVLGVVLNKQQQHVPQWLYRTL